MLEDAVFTNLYQRHAPGLFAYVYRQTASREDAEDLVLDVFVTVLRQPDFVTFDEQKQVAWLWTITRHKMVDYFRRNAHQQHIPIDPLADTLYEDDELSPEHEQLKREEYTRLYRAIKALPERAARGVAIALWLRPALYRNRASPQQKRRSGTYPPLPQHTSAAQHLRIGKQRGPDQAGKGRKAMKEPEQHFSPEINRSTDRALSWRTSNAG